MIYEHHTTHTASTKPRLPYFICFVLCKIWCICPHHKNRSFWVLIWLHRMSWPNRGHDKKMCLWCKIKSWWYLIWLLLTQYTVCHVSKDATCTGMVCCPDGRAAYRYTIRSRYRYYPIPIQGIEMTHSKRYPKSILTSSIWEKSNDNITKYHLANHKYQFIPIKWGNLICEHCPGKLCGNFLYTLLLHRQLQ